MQQLNRRQQFILSLIQSKKKIANRDILIYLNESFDNTSRFTLIRDLKELVKRKLIQKNGKGRNTIYEFSGNKFLTNIDPDSYFKLDTDERLIESERLRFDNLSELKNAFSEKELIFFENLNAKYLKNLTKYYKKAIQKEFERVTIEFSWKSSRIEGNTYSLLDTERLIKLHEESPKNTHSEAVMILNHKKAFDYILNYKNYFKKLNLRKIEELHTLIVKNLGVKTGIRKHGVGIVGTKYLPEDNYYQIRELLQDLIDLLNQIKNPFIKATIAVLGISYIQPFEDGNKRTSRILGNAILLMNNCCPLSYRSVDEVEYKKAMIIFYEKHSLVFFKKLFMEQFAFAVKNYFL